MQIVEYKIEKNTLTVGFKENNFIVYSQIAYDSTKAKQELLQKAYEQCKKAIDYEKTLTEHSFTTNKTGEEFIPAIPRAVKLEIDFNNLMGKVLDQYGDIFSTDIIFSVEGTDKARIENNSIIEDSVTEDLEYFIVAKYGELQEKQKRIIYAQKIIEPKTNNEIADIYEAIIQLDARINSLNGGM